MTTVQAVSIEQISDKAVSLRKDPFSPSKAVEEDRVITMGLEVSDDLQWRLKTDVIPCFKRSSVSDIV